MVSKEQYDNAIKQKDEAEETINLYHKEAAERFGQRLKDNPIFTDEELYYSATSFCPCGHGLAYPKECSPNHYWDCSAILKGIADKNVQHTGKLPFMFYNVKGESERNGTTRGVFKPKQEECLRFVPPPNWDGNDCFTPCTKCGKTEGKHIYDHDGDRIGSGRGYGGGQGVSSQGPSSPND